VLLEAKPAAENGSEGSASSSSLFSPLCASAPLRESSPSPSGVLAQRRGGVFDLAMEMGRGNALIHAFFLGGILGISVYI